MGSIIIGGIIWLIQITSCEIFQIQHGERKCIGHQQRGSIHQGFLKRIKIFLLATQIES